MDVISSRVCYVKDESFWRRVSSKIYRTGSASSSVDDTSLDRETGNLGTKTSVRYR